MRGVTYGPFRPDAEGCVYPAPEVVDDDFRRIAALGANAVRTYTPPPLWLLDRAARHGLRVLAGLAWEQHVAFLDERRRAAAIEGRVRASVAESAGHPALLAWAVGNEIPASIVRWHGARRVERFLERLCRAAREEDPGALVTYVNYPSTEYLDLSFVDFAAFNVYLESEDRLAAYLARLHNLVGDRPLVMAELGLDSRRNGLEAQAASLAWQVGTAMRAGCAGAFVFAWSDAWHRGGADIDDWDFGLVTRDRRPKPALDAIRVAFADAPFPRAAPWPRVSVVVCSRNGERTLRECLDGILALDYPDFEVILVDDGSTDRTAEIGRDAGVRVVSAGGRGLGHARNVGLEAATGEIIAYIDDDAYPDPHWLRYLAAVFLETDCVGAGGPNLPPPDDRLVAGCVAHVPGGPTHVLLTDTVAEHVPGCNMAFRVDALREIGGFDPRFRVAGDDVDVCWRIRARGWTLGYHPAAVVWHHRRDTVRAYWRQQRLYGHAEAILAEKWPERYNAAGHVPWAGRIYASTPAPRRRSRRRRVFHGTWGSAPFQSVYDAGPGPLHSLATVPEWLLVVGALLALAAAGLVWPARVVLPVLALAAGVPFAHAATRAAAAARAGRIERVGEGALRWVLVAVLHLIQPIARLRGRLQGGLTPWRSGGRVSALPVPRTATLWSETWRAPEARLTALEAALHAERLSTTRGDPFDRWDLDVRGGVLGGVRILSAVEEHGAGRQLTRFRLRPHPAPAALGVVLLSGALAAGAATDGARPAAAFLLALAVTLAARTGYECARAKTAVLAAVRRIGEAEREADGDRVGSGNPAPSKPET